MRVLWCCNVVLPKIAEVAGLNNQVNSAGWIEGFLQGLKSRQEIDLGIICPGKKMSKGVFDNIRYWVCGTEDYQSVLDDFSPDILHVFGTENEESNYLVALFNKPNKTVVNIQGMAGLYGLVYADGLPPKMQLRQRLFESAIGNGILDQQRNFNCRGITEADTISRVGHVIGRTDIDRMFALDLNADVQYHFCNEILRKDFYEAQKWDVSRIKRYSMVMRNTGNPIKGLYQMLCAMPDILKRYPDAHLYVIGNAFSPRKRAQQYLTEGSYNRLIRKTIEKYNLIEHITPLGALSAEQMVQLYLQTHVVVSASVIENESNVVSEAKLLGVPVVASFVGGLPNRIQHGYDGYLYPFNMPKMLAYYVSRIFEDDKHAVEISGNAISTQSVINDPQRNIEKLIQVYQAIYDEDSKMGN